MWVIRCGSKYVANPGAESIYVTDIQKARKYKTYKAALTDKCGNETIVDLMDEMNEC